MIKENKVKGGGLELGGTFRSYQKKSPQPPHSNEETGGISMFFISIKKPPAFPIEMRKTGGMAKLFIKKSPQPLHLNGETGGIIQQV